MLTVTGLSKRFGATPVLRGVDLCTEGAPVTAIVGPSGCGKTTLLRCIAGLERPQAGEVRLEGRVLTGPRRFVAPRKREVAVVFQDYALWPHMTVEEHIRFALSGRRLAFEEREGRLQEVLSLARLAGLEGRRPEGLSGGERQRLAIARALAVWPAMLLLDEPLSSIDNALRREIRGEIRNLLQRAGIRAVLVTHDIQDAFAMADRLLVMNGGRIEQAGAPDEVYRCPRTPFVARFVARANVLPARVQGRTLHTPLGDFPANGTGEGEVMVAVRPETITVGDGGVPARVAGKTFLGTGCEYSLDLDGTPVTMFSPEDLRPGAEVHIALTEPPHLLDQDGGTPVHDASVLPEGELVMSRRRD